MRDVFNRGLGRHIDGLGNRAGNKGLHRAHHFDVPHVMNRAAAVGRLEGAVKYRKIFIFEVRRALDGFMLFDVLDDFLDLLDIISQAPERPRHGIVDDL